jgi:hypothetical protein
MIQTVVLWVVTAWYLVGGYISEEHVASMFCSTDTTDYSSLVNRRTANHELKNVIPMVNSFKQKLARAKCKNGGSMFI